MRTYLKELRTKLGVTQSDIAEKLYISESYYNLIENGERQKQLSIEMAQKLADVLGVTLSYICEQETKLNIAR